MGFSEKKVVLRVFSIPQARRTLETPAVLSPACRPAVPPEMCRSCSGASTHGWKNVCSVNLPHSSSQRSQRVSLQRHPSRTQTDGLPPPMVPHPDPHLDRGAPQQSTGLPGVTLVLVDFGAGELAGGSSVPFPLMLLYVSGESSPLFPS